MSMRYQHCFSPRAKTASYQTLWKKTIYREGLCFFVCLFCSLIRSICLFNVKMKLNYHVLYHCPWQLLPNSKAVVLFSSEPFTPWHCWNPSLQAECSCSLHCAQEEMSQAEVELPKLFMEDVQRKGVRRTKSWHFLRCHALFEWETEVDIKALPLGSKMGSVLSSVVPGSMIPKLSSTHLYVRAILTKHKLLLTFKVWMDRNNRSSLSSFKDCVLIWGSGWLFT